MRDRIKSMMSHGITGLERVKEKRGYSTFEEEALARLCGKPALEEAMDLS
jgi:hypothetical protein